MMSSLGRTGTFPYGEAVMNLSSPAPFPRATSMRQEPSAPAARTAACVAAACDAADAKGVDARRGVEYL